MPGIINLADLPADLRRQLQLPAGTAAPRKQKARSMTKDDIRTAAFRVMNVLADLTPAERSRVLAQAIKLNGV